MVAIYRVHGSSANIQAAMRSDKQWFERIQVRGYQGRLVWTKWQTCLEPETKFINEYAGKARLPKVSV